MNADAADAELAHAPHTMKPTHDNYGRTYSRGPRKEVTHS